jgi:hypothetical protein
MTPVAVHAPVRRDSPGFHVPWMRELLAADLAGRKPRGRTAEPAVPTREAGRSEGASSIVRVTAGDVCGLPIDVPRSMRASKGDSVNENRGMLAPSGGRLPIAELMPARGAVVDERALL